MCIRDRKQTGELVLAHTTKAMCVGYMSDSDNKPVVSNLILIEAIHCMNTYVNMVITLKGSNQGWP